MSISTTLAHAAIKDLQSALNKVNRMMSFDTEVVMWEIVKAIESIEDLLGVPHE